jgi:uncharacterized protein YdaU (DUF1376 family)
MHYYQHHIGDFIKDTSFLTNEEVGIYMKLIWLYYDTEAPLPNDTPVLAMKLNCRGSEQTVRNILGLYFRFIDDRWHHTRCDDEIAHFHKQLEVASKAGKASAAKRKGNAISTPVEHPLDLGSTPVQLTNNQEPITKNHIKTTPPPDGVSSDLWSDFLVYRKRLKAPVTPRVLERLIKEANLAKMPLDQVLETIIFKGWRSFEASWVTQVTGASAPKNNQEWRTNDNLMIAKANELGLHTVGLQRFEIVNKIDATLRSRGL